jgi:glutaconate CoA-transferase subunit B
VLRRLLPGAAIKEVLENAEMWIKVPEEGVNTLEPVTPEEMRVIEEADPEGVSYMQRMG